MAVRSSEGTGKEGKTDGVALCVWECFNYLKLDDVDESVECFWVRTGGSPRRQISWWESVMDCPARTERHMKFSISIREAAPTFVSQ